MDGLAGGRRCLPLSLGNQDGHLPQRFGQQLEGKTTRTAKRIVAYTWLLHRLDRSPFLANLVAFGPQIVDVHVTGGRFLL